MFCCVAKVSDIPSFRDSLISTHTVRYSRTVFSKHHALLCVSGLRVYLSFRVGSQRALAESWHNCKIIGSLLKLCALGLVVGVDIKYLGLHAADVLSTLSVRSGRESQELAPLVFGQVGLSLRVEGLNLKA